MFPLPLDKMLMAVLVMAICWLYPDSLKQSTENYIVYGFVCLTCVLSAVVNLIIRPIPLFPIIALAFVFLVARHKQIIDLLFVALTWHIIMGVILLMVSYAYKDMIFYSSLAGKGLPFIHTPVGFVSTVQVFGTLCIIWMIIYFEKVKATGHKKGYKFLYFIVTLALLLTLNRSTFLFYFVLLAFKDRRLLCIYVFLIMLTIVILVKVGLGSIFFGTQTLTSRSELLEGFNLSFWRGGTIMTYIFGKGDNFLTQDILNRVKWDFRQDIENGYAMLLHTYGFFGLTIFIISGSIFVLKLILEQRWYLAAIVGYYFFVSSFFTQEFVSVSFYIFLLVILIIRKNTGTLRYKII